MRAARRTSPWLAGLVGLALAMLAAGPALAQEAAPQEPPDVPAGPGSLTGRVLKRPSGEVLPGVDVVLYALSGQGPGLRRTRTDASGGFRFEGLSTDPAIGWLLGTRYQGVPFPGGRVSFAEGPEQQVDLRVTELSRDAASIHVTEVVLQLSRGGPGGTLRVSETLTLRNDAEETFYVPQGERRSAPATRAELPPGATAFEMPLGVVPEGLERFPAEGSGGERLRYWGPVYPGTQELTWSYGLPAGSDPLRVAWQARLPSGADRVKVLLPAGLGEWTAPGWEELEPEEHLGQRHRVLARGAVAPGSRLEAGLQLPPTRLDPDAVKVEEVQVIVRADDAALDVTETHRLRIEGDAAVLGTAESPLLEVPVPAGARGLRFGSDGAAVQLVPARGGGLAAVGTASPGELSVELAYRLPVEAPPARLERQFTRRVPVLSIFVADTGRLEPASERLHRRRPVRTQDLTYMHLEAFEVDPGEAVGLDIGLRAPRRTASPTAARAVTALAALAVIALLVAPLRRQSGGLTERDDETASRREREALYAAIRDLDHDHETGKLSDEDHATLRSQLRGRAAALLQREEQETQLAQAGAAPQAEAPACDACGAALETSHRFCPQCGAARITDGSDQATEAAGAGG